MRSSPRFSVFILILSDRVCSGILSVLLLEVLTVVILSVILMHLECIVLSYLDNASSNVGAMVGNTLEISEYIRENESVLNSTFALL